VSIGTAKSVQTNNFFGLEFPLQNSSIGIIIGVIVGVFVALIIVALILVRRKTQRLMVFLFLSFFSHQTKADRRIK